MLGQYHRSCNLVSTLWTPAWACWWVSRINSRRMAAGQTTLSLAGCPWLAAKNMVSRPSGPICSEFQRWQYSRSSAHPCLRCLSLGRRLLVWLGIRWLPPLGDFPGVVVAPWRYRSRQVWRGGTVWSLVFPKRRGDDSTLLYCVTHYNIILFSLIKTVPQVTD